ncbi:NCA2-domain-containing protein [Dissoconium aciculare CBS 342.82]|uniref:NCA2-domain-containing protein n=1 Tax=Dissoconium aciculare CBS 342.82 TaxID=1314786 RepID=A0A6J3MF89_9PEZI|nr:NCA2-domain-containing protein [Dissoconium aciculare CBS 342.82]KAF1826513.1 NCA2-domain-containing protein [Dissoconium aciculare CBS 342.82]
MSFVLDQVHRIDGQLNRIQLAPNFLAPNSTGLTTTEALHIDSLQPQQSSTRQPRPPSARVLALQAAIRGASPGISHSRALLRTSQIKLALAALSRRTEARGLENDEQGSAEQDPFEHELEWLLVSKITTQVYGVVLKNILDHAVDISNDVWYWDAVLSSRVGTLIYSVQTSPARFWRWGNVVWADVQARGGHFDIRSASRDTGDTLSKRWGQFYKLVRDVVAERSVAEVNKHILSPVSRIRAEIRLKQTALKKIRMRNANALGVLLGEGLANECVHGDGMTTPTPANVQDVQGKWKASVGRNVALIEAVLAKTTDLDTPVDGYDGAIAELTEEDPLYTLDLRNINVSPQHVGERLSRILTIGLPQYETASKALVRRHGKPSRLVRYWLPITIGLLSSSTVLRILASRQAQLVQWVSDLGSTVVDFWTNWVLEPTRNVIKTIRHDESSAISLLSRRSLEGDRESLERMVIDFAIDNPAHVNDTGATTALTDVQVAEIRAKVREGDLTPVLRAYEKDLTSPVLGALRGNLIRALLIQIQKTKVDVEVAMGGIDSLLKSQELLIGFISLTPGLLVAWGLIHYIRTTILTTGASKKSSAARRQEHMLRQLRNVDRILTAAQPTQFGELLYKDQGLLICEVHILRLAAARIMPTEILREFGEEVDELCDVRVGVERQRRVGERIRWAYRRWLK